MRTFIFLLCATTFAFSPSNGFSQDAPITISNDETLSLEEVFNLIQTQTDYMFVYRSDELMKSPTFKIRGGVIKTSELLKKSLIPLGYNYSFEDNIVIVKKERLSKANTTQQKIDVSGVVTDSLGIPLVGATVLLKDTQRATSTSLDGEFELANVLVGSTLMFSYVGFISQKIEISRDNAIGIVVVLKEDISALNEVTVVSSGYQIIAKERATGSFGSLKKDQIEKPASSISERLIGTLSGVQQVIDREGNSSFQIRGLTTLGADKNPLIVLDGFPVEGGFETINPNNVESVTILKDAAAASIWGARAANGVIVITTKKNKSNDLKVSISSFLRFSQKFDLDYSLNRASNSDYIKYLKLGFEGNNFGSGFNPINPRNLLTLGSPSPAIYTAFYNSQYDAISMEERDNLLDKYARLDNTKQIRQYLLQNPIVRQYNFSVTGGNEKIDNNLTLLYEASDGPFQGDNINKYQINFSNTTSLSKKLEFNFSGMMQYNDEINNGLNLSELKDFSRADMLTDADGNLVDMSYLYNNLLAINDFRPDLSLFPYGGNLSYNPITEIKNRNRSIKELNTRIQTGLNLEIVNGLSISSSIQYEIFNTTRKNLYNDKTYAVREAIIKTSIPNPSGYGVPTQVIPSGSVLQEDDQNVNSYIFRNQISFNKNLFDKHSINFIGGIQNQERIIKFNLNPIKFGFNNESLQFTGSVPDNIFFSQSYAGFYNNRPIYNYSIGSPFITSSFTNNEIKTENTNRFVSYYANLGYTYDNRYIFTASYRTDASNLIADDPSVRSNPFWSIGLAWNLNQESFMWEINWLNSLKLRTTFGVGGNVDSSTSAVPLLSLNPVPNSTTGELLSSISNVGNPLLRWERTESFNLGFDFSLFKNKLYGSMDYYNKQSGDLIVLQSIPNVNGNTTAMINNGKMLNRGVEIELSTFIPINDDNIVWRGSLNYTYNKNKITKFFKTSYSFYELLSTFGRPVSLGYIEGYNANTLWAYNYAGVNNLGGVDVPAYYSTNGELASFLANPTGDASEYLLPSGTSVAPTIIGTTQSFKIYDFNLSFILQGKFGHKFRRTTFDYQYQMNKPINSFVNEALNAGDGSTIPPIITDNFLYFRYNNVAPYLKNFIEDASHIRLQEINLSYNLPQHTLNKIHIKKLQLYLQGNNLGTILFNEYGEDPEYPRGYYRPQAIYTLGFNLNF